MNLSWHYYNNEELVLETPLPELRPVMKLPYDVGRAMMEDLRAVHRTSVDLEEVLDWLRNNAGLL